MRRILRAVVPALDGASGAEPGLGEVVIDDDLRAVEALRDSVPQILATGFPPSARRVLKVDGESDHGGMKSHLNADSNGGLGPRRALVHRGLRLSVFLRLLLQLHKDETFLDTSWW